MAGRLLWSCRQIPVTRDGFCQCMTEEEESLKYDLKHTISARARAEGREDEVQSNLSAVEGELQEVRNVLRVAQNELA